MAACPHDRVAGGLTVVDSTVTPQHALRHPGDVLLSGPVAQRFVVTPAIRPRCGDGRVEDGLVNVHAVRLALLAQAGFAAALSFVAGLLLSGPNHARDKPRDRPGAVPRSAGQLGRGQDRYVARGGMHGRIRQQTA